MHVPVSYTHLDVYKRQALLYAQDIRSRFPDKVREEAKKLENAEVTEKDTEGHMDLRALPIFTIDSAETKDICLLYTSSTMPISSWMGPRAVTAASIPNWRKS